MAGKPEPVWMSSAILRKKSWVLAAQAHGKGRLHHLCIDGRLQHEVGKRIHRVEPVHVHAADADVLERTESGVMRRCGFVPIPDLFAELDPHAFDEFQQRLGVGEDACLHIALVVGIEVLVHSARRIAARVAFDEQAHEDEVVELHGFTEGLRRVFGDSVAGLGHAQQFGLAGAVLFGGGQLAAACAWRRQSMEKPSQVMVMASQKSRRS